MNETKRAWFNQEIDAHKTELMSFINMRGQMQALMRDAPSFAEFHFADIRNGIDPTQGYPRGTFATYRGGTIKALRDTDPVVDGLARAGWEVVLDGIADVALSQSEDLRVVTITTITTSSRMHSFAFAVLGWESACEEQTVSFSMTLTSGLCHEHSFRVPRPRSGGDRLH